MPKQTPRRGARRARAPDGPASTRLSSKASELLFDLGVLLQAVDISLKFRLHDAVGQLSLHLVERRVARILQLDDVPAVLGLHGLGRDLTFLQAFDGIAERLDHAREGKPT